MIRFVEFGAVCTTEVEAAQERERRMFWDGEVYMVKVDPGEILFIDPERIMHERSLRPAERHLCRPIERRAVIIVSPADCEAILTGEIRLPKDTYVAGFHPADPTYPATLHVILGGPGLPDAFDLSESPDGAPVPIHYAEHVIDRGYEHWTDGRAAWLLPVKILAVLPRPKT
jgi:hypothetical protein